MLPKVRVLHFLLETLAAVNMAALRSSDGDSIEIGVVRVSRASDGSKEHDVIASVPWQSRFDDILKVCGHDNIDSALRELERLEDAAQ